MGSLSPWCILLDRDGTVIEEKHYLHDPDGVVLLPGAAQGLARLTQAGCRLALVTNQSGIGRGLFAEEDMHKVHTRLCELLAEHGVSLDGIFFCPHAPEMSCTCRKPLPGLFNQAMKALGGKPERTCVIGDKACDVDLGLHAGSKGILVRTGHGLKEPATTAARAHMVANDLDEAASWILEHCLP